MNLAMNSKQLVNIETTVPGYKYGMILQTGSGYSSKKEIYLFSDKYISENFIKGDMNKVGSAVFGCKEEKGGVSLENIINSVIIDIENAYPHLKISLSTEQNEDFITADCQRIKILMLAVFYMAFEVDLNDEIRLTLRKRNGKQEIVLSSNASAPKFLNGVVDFCNVYPFATTSALFAMALSNEMEIGLSIFQEYEYFEMLLVLGKDEGDSYGVYVESNSENMLLYEMCKHIFLNNK